MKHYLLLFFILVFSVLSTAVNAQCLAGNCKDGNGVYVFKGNTATYTGSFQASLPSGQGTCEYSNGDSYEGQWAKGVFEGEGTLFQANGKTIQGLWSKGQFKNSVISKSNFGNIKEVKGKTYALVIGIADYTHMPALRFADDDAYQMYAFLQAAEGMALPDSQVRLLIDEAATKDAILSAMDDLYSNAGPDDLVLLYFSGHGLKGSFLPFDYDGFYQQLYHSEIKQKLNASDALNKVCIADACHAGSLTAYKGVDEFWQTEYEALMLEEEAKIALMLSSKSNERSLESQGLRQGVFSHFLIKGLKGKADRNADRQITLQETFEYVRSEVREYTGKRQSPLLEGSFDPGLVLNKMK